MTRSIRQSTQKALSFFRVRIVDFAKWYWKRVKEIPFVFFWFSLGCVVEAVMISAPQIAAKVLG